VWIWPAVRRGEPTQLGPAIHRLAAEQPTVLAVSITPDTRAGPGVNRATLSALGKRLDRARASPRPDLADAERLGWWPHRIAELIVLRAQHLPGSASADDPAVPSTPSAPRLLPSSSRAAISRPAGIAVLHALHRAHLRAHQGDWVVDEDGMWQPCEGVYVAD
jgi:hypothetical protein